MNVRAPIAWTLLLAAVAVAATTACVTRPRPAPPQPGSLRPNWRAPTPERPLAAIRTRRRKRVRIERRVPV